MIVLPDMMFTLTSRTPASGLSARRITDTSSAQSIPATRSLTDPLGQPKPGEHSIGERAGDTNMSRLDDPAEEKTHRSVSPLVGFEKHVVSSIAAGRDVQAVKMPVGHFRQSIGEPD